MTPSDHKSQRLSYATESDSPMKASTTSGAMNSALPTCTKHTDYTSSQFTPNPRLLTGVRSCGVASGLETLDWKRMPDPKSKSQIFTGHKLSLFTHRMFSGLRSRCAMPLACMNCNAEATSLTISAAAASLKYLFS